jgi:hypothetical protein
VEFFVTWSIITGLLIVPGLFNYFLNLAFTEPGTPLPSRAELAAASLALTFALLVVTVFVSLAIALLYDDLNDEITDFVNMGLVDYAQNRPIALTGVFSAFSVALTAIMALLGTFRFPSRIMR